MNSLVVRTDRGNLTVAFDFSAFITNWEAAKRTFVAGVADCFREPLNPRPGDFSAASSAELGESWCKYRIFGGSSTIELRADSLALSFANIIPGDYEIVIAIVRGTMGTLLPTLQGYERQSYRVSSNYHLHVRDGRSDAYLEHHGSKAIGAAAAREPEMEYCASVGFTLRTNDGHRVFRRTIEQSEVLQNGLFISDNTFVSMPILTGFEEELSWIERTTGLADRAAGIAHERDEGQ